MEIYTVTKMVFIFSNTKFFSIINDTISKVAIFSTLDEILRVEYGNSCYMTYHIILHTTYFDSVVVVVSCFCNILSGISFSVNPRLDRSSAVHIWGTLRNPSREY
jgi:hypothetical protein